MVFESGGLGTAAANCPCKLSTTVSELNVTDKSLNLPPRTARADIMFERGRGTLVMESWLKVKSIETAPKKSSNTNAARNLLRGSMLQRAPLFPHNSQ